MITARDVKRVNSTIDTFCLYDIQNHDLEHVHPFNHLTCLISGRSDRRLTVFCPVVRGQRNRFRASSK